jgi:hypothetical protein
MKLSILVRFRHLPALWLAVLLGCTSGAADAPPSTNASESSPLPASRPPAPQVLTRLFFQDYETKSLKWLDVQEGSPLTLGPAATVEGFPPLDPARQELVQMEVIGEHLLVGVRESDEDRRSNGWVLVHTGVRGVSHGDHADWSYRQHPRVLARQLDGEQGNPAHLYQYDGVFYLANDERSGYTRLDPRTIRPEDDEAAIRSAARFLPGGGHHITLAVADNRVGYAAWIDGDGPHKGRVDVTPLDAAGTPETAYSFQLPSGGIHGAVVCQGKVFLAPADGLCWVAADLDLRFRDNPQGVQVHHIALGRDPATERPLRTGAFTTFGKYVLCVCGAGPTAALCLLDASQETPQPRLIGLDMQAGNRPVTPEVVQTRSGKRYAFVFHDHPQDVEAEDRLSIIDLDPDGDGDFADARVEKSLLVGPCRLEGHYGHHSISFDADGRRAFFTNPGNGLLVVLDLRRLEPVLEHPLGGIPTKLLAVGGREERH